MSYWIVILTSAAIGALALIAVALFLMARWLAMILDQHRRSQRQCRSGVISITCRKRKAGERRPPHES